MEHRILQPDLARCLLVITTAMTTLSTLSACRDDSAPAVFEQCDDEGTNDVGELSPPSQSPTNVLMISIDTLRRDRVGRYACDEQVQTPFMDTLFEEAIILDDHRSCSNWTYTSVICALSGMSTVDIGFHPYTNPDTGLSPYKGQVPMLATRLHGAGWNTSLVSSTTFLSDKFGLIGGYEHTDYSPSRAEVVIQKTLAEIERLSLMQEPWFHHLHLSDPHDPYSPPEAYLEGLAPLDDLPWDLDTKEGYKQMSANLEQLDAKTTQLLGQHLAIRYDGEIRYLDSQLHGLFGHLEERGHLDSLLVVFWSDHGEQFWEHGDWGHGPSLHHAENRGIAAFWGPEIEPVAWQEPTTHADITPTLLYLLGLDPDPLMTGSILGTASSDRPLFALGLRRTDPVQQLISYEGMTMLYGWDGTLNLYDHSADPSETIDLATTDPESTEKLWNRLLPEIERVEELLPEQNRVSPTNR